MKYKLVVLDLDGTLLDDSNTISERTAADIAYICEQGIKVIIATGRMLISAMPYVQQLNLSGPVITYNGAYIKDIEQDQVIYHKPVALNVALSITEDCKREDLHLNYYEDDRLYVEEKNELSRAYELSSGVEAEEVGSLSQFAAKDPTKLLVIENDRERHQHYLKYFQNKYEGQLEITESKKHYIEFTASNVSKGNSLKFLTQKLGYKQEEVIAVGDGGNDLHMIQWAGLGVAMADAAPGVKAAADMIAPVSEEEGVAVILEKIFDIPSHDKITTSHDKI